jgi:hypothetical protein
MTLEAKDMLIRDLVRENPDTTIKYYLEVLNEIERIEEADAVSVDHVIENRLLHVRDHVFETL